MPHHLIAHELDDLDGILRLRVKRIYVDVSYMNHAKNLETRTNGFTLFAQSLDEAKEYTPAVPRRRTSTCIGCDIHNP